MIIFKLIVNIGQNKSQHALHTLAFLHYRAVSNGTRERSLKTTTATTATSEIILWKKGLMESTDKTATMWDGKLLSAD